MIGPALQQYGVSFLEVEARHRNGTTIVTLAVLSSESDRQKFAEFCEGRGIEVRGDVRIATLDEIKKHEEIAW